MIWDLIFGRQELVQTLQEAVRDNRVAHAYLFTGEGGSGKKKVAAVFAAALNCQIPSSGGCGTCLPCQKSLGGSYPDLHWVQPDGKSVKIEQIRIIRKQAYIKPRDGYRQVFVIEAADTMTLEAANSLLKVLEEPPEGNVFVLLAEQPERLPVTVRSRCQIVLIPGLDTVGLEEFLASQDIFPDRQELDQILAWSAGNAGRALTFADSTARQSEYDRATDFIEEVFLRRDVSQFAAKLSETENLPAFFETVALVFRDMLIVQAMPCPPAVILVGDEDKIRALSGSWNAGMCRAALQILQQQQVQLQKNVQTRFLVEKVLRDLKEVLTCADSCGDTL